MIISLADLTYTQQSIASDVVPAGIGMIAEYVEKKLPDINKIKLYKFPEDLSEKFETNKPDLIGFSNYIWNSSLTDTYLKRIKEVFPDIITVAGGPNFPTNEMEQKKYLSIRPWIDFYIVKEGEHAFYSLINYFIENKIKDISQITNNQYEHELSNLPNLVFFKNNLFVSSKKIERIMDLSEIPSPYLSGRLDEFLDGKLLPITQTNRGCPFTCTFCTEGQGYWTKVRRKPRDIVEGEVKYISSKMNSLSATKKRTDLLIADSNFGMFEEDLDTCKVIAEEQDKNGYPKYINVATGKNKKERVLEAAKIVNGAMKLAGSVQSLDPEVQENIKRKNISSDQVVDMALKSSEIGANTYSEVILGLPGDTLDKHFATLKTLVESDFTTISMYQLMILPGTELGSQETKEKYEMDTRYRVVPRCYGTYDILDKKISVSEIEEICVSTNTLSFNNYLECRKMNLIINIFYNDGIFDGIIKLLRIYDISIWEWLESIYNNSKEKEFSEFENLLNDFLDEYEKELWKSYDDLRNFCEDSKNIKKFIEGKLGSNLIFKYKSRSLTGNLINSAEIAKKSSIEIISKKNLKDENISAFIDDLIKYKLCEVENLFNIENVKEQSFNYDIKKFLNLTIEDLKIQNLESLLFDDLKKITFSLSDDQKNQLKSYNELFGNSIEGISRTLSRVYVKKLFRKPIALNSKSELLNEFQDNNSRRWGGGLESI
jgi:radical SAM superfamily enzyme YgiQ (UPF0313 family)